MRLATFLPALIGLFLALVGISAFGLLSPGHTLHFGGIVLIAFAMGQALAAFAIATPIPLAVWLILRLRSEYRVLFLCLEAAALTAAVVLMRLGATSAARH